MRQIGSALLLLVFTLSGCATNSESPCQSRDWEAVGFDDGANGSPAAQLLSYQHVCVDQHVIPDRDAYLAGWKKGIALYCRPGNGFTLGRQGAPYSSVCPEDQQAEFYAAFQNGRAVYKAQIEIERMSQSLRARQNELSRITAALDSAQDTSARGSSPDAIPAAALAEHDALRKEQRRLQAEIESLERELTRLSLRLSPQPGTLAAASN